MARVYRSRARRRTRRLVVLAAVFAVFAVADVAAGNPALAVLADTGAAVADLVGPDGGGSDAAAPAASRASKPVPSAPTGTAAPATSRASKPVPSTPTGTPAPAPAPVPGPVAGREPIVSVPAGRVALTIDDGPDPRWTPQVLDLLAARGVHATFCLIGYQVRAHPDLVRRIVAEGHTLCDHTESHDVRLPDRSQAAIDREVRTAYDEIVAASGGVRPTLFRAPGGNWSPTVIAAAATLGMRPLGWSVDPRDWARPTTAAITATVRAAPSGAVILVHDGGGDRSRTLAALRIAVPALQARGLLFVTP
jgi:peptidoglycan/xylan/chitin deacetylase (PgdA/CDA1 family)